MFAPCVVRDRGCMSRSNRSGTTLFELVCVLTLLGVIAGLAAQPFANTCNVIAVRAARSTLVSAAARTRAHAVRHGGADLLIDSNNGTLRITTRDRVIDDMVPLNSVLAVRIQLDGTQAKNATLQFDALGIGRVASRTISLHRGGVTAGVTFSSYGRARTW
jgi:Tfp pilus assembly protein FimT